MLLLCLGGCSESLKIKHVGTTSTSHQHLLGGFDQNSSAMAGVDCATAGHHCWSSWGVKLERAWYPVISLSEETPRIM